jgi:hypothetical protein
MSRRIPVYVLEARLAAAKKAATFYANPDRNPVKATVDKRAKVEYAYRSVGYNITAATALFLVQATQASVAYFGGAADLKLIESGALNFSDATPSPKTFHPSMIHLVNGDATPTAKISRATGKRYIKYAATNAGEAQSAYSAPVGATGTVGTITEQKATAKVIATAKKGTAGVYGRCWFTAETESSSLF